jgi:hypothetical protein
VGFITFIDVDKQGGSALQITTSCPAAAKRTASPRPSGPVPPMKPIVDEDD